MGLFGKKKDFVKMLYMQAQKAEEGLYALKEYIDDPSEKLANKVGQLEAEADELRRILIEELNRSFVTPFDREDIFALSRAIDDTIDYAKSTVEEMRLFEVSPNKHIKEIVDVLYRAGQDISSAVRLIQTHPQSCSEYIIRAKKNENHIEHYYREALAELFKDKDVVHILKLREIYRHLSNAADRGDEAANIIGDILVKMT